MGDTIRIGNVSSIDYSSGMVRVTYKDKGDTVTAPMSYVSNGVYKMPKVDDRVLVVHMSNGNSKGVCLGTLWNKSNNPSKSGQDQYSNLLSNGCAINSSGGALSFTASAGTISVETLLSMYDRLGELENIASNQSAKISTLEGKVAALGG